MRNCGIITMVAGLIVIGVGAAVFGEPRVALMLWGVLVAYGCLSP